MYTLPGTIEKKWVDTNDAEVGLSELRVTETAVYVPEHIYFDSLVDTKIEPLGYEQDAIVYSVSLLEEIQQARRESYHACKWYPEIRDVIPTAPSVLRNLASTKGVDIRSTPLHGRIEKLVTVYSFVRLCSMSPKDVSSCLFQNAEELYQALETSERTRAAFQERRDHLFFREPRIFTWEARCFWSKQKLRAVSVLPGFTDQKKVLDFFEKYGPEIPYHSAVVDIGLNESTGEVELIEFNSFGPDLLATAGNFSWYEDCHLLLNSPEVVFR